MALTGPQREGSTKRPVGRGPVTRGDTGGVPKTAKAAAAEVPGVFEVGGTGGAAALAADVGYTGNDGGRGI